MGGARLGPGAGAWRQPNRGARPCYARLCDVLTLRCMPPQLDPNNYPNSRFKEQRVLWYVQQVTPPGVRATWLLDNEQTDTEVSPWEVR